MTRKVTTKFIRNPDTLKDVQRTMLRYGLRGMLVQTDDEGHYAIIAWMDDLGDEFRKEVEERFDVKVVV